MHAVWASETAVNRMIPDFTPRPLCVGIYNSDSETHFFLAEFIDMVQDVVPPPDKYMAPVVALHSRTMGKSPTGRFGFHTGTAYGDILQNNTWESSWESFWTRVMREAFETEERMCGPHDERLKALKAAWFDCVLPRYLRPLESEGRSVTPCLVHADLWPGNCRYTSNMDAVCVYDANAFWGHNEGTYHVSAPRHAFHQLEVQLIENFQLTWVSSAIHATNLESHTWPSTGNISRCLSHEKTQKAETTSIWSGIKCSSLRYFLKLED